MAFVPYCSGHYYSIDLTSGRTIDTWTSLCFFELLELFGPSPLKNGGDFCWKSFKLSVVANSTMEAEYIAVSGTAKEAVWIRQFWEGLKMIPSASDPTPLYCDNSGTVFQSKEPKSSNKSRHVHKKLHVIRDYVKYKEIAICKVGTDKNVGNPLTKSLSQVMHDNHVISMGLSRVPELL